MLKRTKYSRLRNDSLTSLDDQPQRMLPLKRDLCLDSDIAQHDPRTPAHYGPSSLRDFTPRVANIPLQSPISVQGPRGQTCTAWDTTIDGHIDRPLSRPEWGSGQNQSALRGTKRPITLQRTATLSWNSGCARFSQHRDGPCCLESSSAVDDYAAVGTAHHHIKYMGSVEVTQSMRTLDFDTRMKVTREAMSRLCERTSAVKPKRPLCKGLSALLGQINLQFSGSRVILTVSTDSLTLIAASSFQKIAHHPMQAISFASGGDTDMADYIAYVAKDLLNQRACHILECPRGRAGEVINSIGQAFEDRFRQLLNHTPSLLSNNPRSAERICHSPEKQIIDQKAETGEEVRKHRDYYNVIPRKMPPAGGMEDLLIMRKENKQNFLSPQPVTLYENCSITEETPAPPAEGLEGRSEQCTPLSGTQIQNLIQDEGWFHGRLGREQAESLLTCSGDFLVRESSSASGQYVLSGMEGATVRHLLLVDPHGQVRTSDQVFLSISHLVRFHMENHMPIISGSSELCLKQPISQRY